MRVQIEKRLSDLKEEYSQGERIIAELNDKRETVLQSMLRISGAIQVLNELLAEDEKANAKIIEPEATEHPER